MMKVQYIGITLLLVSTLTAASAQAGQVTIHNDNCAALFTSHVDVHVWAPDESDENCQDPDVSSLECSRNYQQHCTEVNYRISKGSSRLLNLAVIGYNGTQMCAYVHEAAGTVGGSKDVYGDETSSVTCKNDWFGVCQCTKD
jgi:hypothetical protein